MNYDLNLQLAQQLNKQQVERSTSERLAKELQAAETNHEADESQ